MSAASRQERSRARWLAASAACVSLVLVAGVEQVVANGWQSFVFRGPGIGASAEQQDDAGVPTEAAAPEAPGIAPAPTEPAEPAPEEQGPAPRSPASPPDDALPEAAPPAAEQAMVTQRLRPPGPRHRRHPPPPPPRPRQPFRP